MKPRFLFSLLLVLSVVGCQTASSTALPTFTKSPMPATASATLTPIPTLTSTPIYESLPVALGNSGKWRMTEPYTFKDWPTLILPDGDVYKLDKNYEVQSIELSYQWWGMGDPVFNYQKIMKSGNGYVMAGKAIPKTKIESFLNSISNLHIVPQTLSSVTHTDDYPIWAIEIAGKDDTKILLTSTSNTPSYVPWNVIYNGEIYTQFNSSIPTALAELFTVEQGQPMASFFPGGQEEGKLVVSSNGWPNQLTYGFNGLLPLQTAFRYWVDSKTGELAGVVDGRSSIGGFGNMIIGSITALQKIALEKTDKSRINCLIETLKSDDPTAMQWSFKCPVEKSNVEGAYWYRIQTTFGTDKGEKITSDGNLFGDWNRGVLMPRTIFPPELANALDKFEPYNTLAKNYQIFLLSFDAKIDTLNSKLDEAVNADVVLLGSLRMDGREIPYSLTTSFGIEQGKVVRWDIDDSELRTLLTDVLKQPITKKLLTKNVDAVLNLFYFESSRGADVGLAEGMNSSGQSWFRLAQCEGIPWEKTLPDEHNPLREFAVNGSWNKNTADLVLLDDIVRVLDFHASTAEDDKSPFSALLPPALSLAKRPLNIGVNMTWGPYIQLLWPQDASQADIASYTEMIKQLPGTKQFHDWGAELKDAIFVVNEQGTLDLVACKSIK